MISRKLYISTPGSFTCTLAWWHYPWTRVWVWHLGGSDHHETPRRAAPQSFPAARTLRRWELKLASSVLISSRTLRRQWWDLVTGLRPTKYCTSISIQPAMSQIIAIFSLRGTQREVIFNYQYWHKRHLSPMTGIRKWQLDMISLCSLLQTTEKRKPHIPTNCLNRSLCFQSWKAEIGKI